MEERDRYLIDFVIRSITDRATDQVSYWVMIVDQLNLKKLRFQQQSRKSLFLSRISMSSSEWPTNRHDKLNLAFYFDMKVY